MLRDHSAAPAIAPASEPAARQSHTTASAPEPEAPQPDSAAPASALSGPERPTAPSPSATATSGAALPHPLPESGAPALTSLDHSPPTTLTLTLGQSRRLHLERDATTVLVATPEVADVQLLAPNVLYVIGKGIGRTSVAVLDENKRIEERVVAVVLDLEPLRTILAGEPDLLGVRARRLSRGMALTGEVPSAASADRALRLAAGALPEGVQIENELQIAAPQQVNLEVQIAEVHRSVTEDLGVNWEAFRIRGDDVFGFQIGRVIDGFPPTAVGGQLSPAFSFSRDTGNTRIGAMIDALATAGLANVLARPNLTAVSGESASFFSGGERPLPTGYDSKTETILFEYKKVGVLLAALGTGCVRPLAVQHEFFSPASGAADRVSTQTQHTLSHHRAMQVARHACRSPAPATASPDESNAPGGPNPAFAAAREALAELCATPQGPPAAAYGGTSNAYRRWVEDQVRELPEPSETAASAAGGS